MNEEVSKALEHLADKLGTTVGHLWIVLVRQAPISSAIDLSTLIAFILIAALWSRFVGKRAESPFGLRRDFWESDVSGWAWASVALIWILTIIGVSVSLPGIVAGFVNPEYWALQDLSRLIVNK